MLSSDPLLFVALGLLAIGGIVGGLVWLASTAEVLDEADDEGSEKGGRS